MRYVRALAAAQTVAVPGDVSANIAQHLELARIATQERAKVVVFPELSLTGYELELAPALAFAEDDARLGPLSGFARASGATLIVGAPVRVAAKLHVGAFILYSDGSLELHTKRHLGAGFPPEASPNGIVPPLESAVFEPGILCPPVRLGDHEGAVAICAESFQRWVAREAAERGAKTYLSSHFGIPSDLAQRIAGLSKIAAHYGMAVVFANYAGVTGGLVASGGSAILSDTGELLVQLERQGQGVAIAIEDETGRSAKAVMV